MSQETPFQKFHRLAKDAQTLLGHWSVYREAVAETCEKVRAPGYTPLPSTSDRVLRFAYAGSEMFVQFRPGTKRAAIEYGTTIPSLGARRVTDHLLRSLELDLLGNIAGCCFSIHNFTDIQQHHLAVLATCAEEALRLSFDADRQSELDSTRDPSTELAPALNSTS